mmetsp:Transcript_25952/g.41560  ORF Transcript_25952/g.41560 Transcript_25952/m.41560 type:complete len:425 (-) Transcript_25952:132-1406(-)
MGFRGQRAMGPLPAIATLASLAWLVQVAWEKASPAWVLPRELSASRVALHSVPLYRINGGDALLGRLSEETVQPLNEAGPLEIGLPEETDIGEVVELMQESFARILSKNRLGDWLGPIAGIANAYKAQGEIEEIYKGVAFRLDIRLSFPSLARPTKNDETVALVARAPSPTGRGQGPLVAYVELCMLVADGRKPEDDPATAPPNGEVREPYLSNLCVAPEYRQMGIGRALLHVAEDLVKYSWRNDKVYLHIDTYMPSRKLYESVGYQEVSPTGEDGQTHMFRDLGEISEEEEEPREDEAYATEDEEEDEDDDGVLRLSAGKEDAAESEDDMSEKEIWEGEDLEAEEDAAFSLSKEEADVVANALAEDEVEEEEELDAEVAFSLSQEEADVVASALRAERDPQFLAKQDPEGRKLKRQRKKAPER